MLSTIESLERSETKLVIPARDSATNCCTREKAVALARDARGMWEDRDPDAYLTASRARLKDRDKELTRARLDA